MIEACFSVGVEGQILMTFSYSLQIHIVFPSHCRGRRVEKSLYWTGRAISGRLMLLIIIIILLLLLVTNVSCFLLKRGYHTTKNIRSS